MINSLNGIRQKLTNGTLLHQTNNIYAIIVHIYRTTHARLIPFCIHNWKGQYRKSSTMWKEIYNAKICDIITVINLALVYICYNMH